MKSMYIPTQFISATRANHDDLEHEADLFTRQPLLRQFVDAMPDVFLILNQHRQIIYVNQTLLDFLQLDRDQFEYGMRPGEVLGCRHAVESHGGCGTTEFCKTCGAARAIISSIKGRKAVEECRITRVDGTALDLQVWTTPLDIEDQRFTIFTVKDISSEKRRRALERIFFHDILNTAGVVLNYIEFLQEFEGQEREEMTQQIHEFTLRLIDEIEAQRVLSSAESNELRIKPVWMQSGPFLTDTAMFYSGHRLAMDRRVIISTMNENVSFVSDMLLLRRVIENMIKNALEATETGATVTLSCATEAEAITFFVHNPGYIPRDVQLQIFQRSFSTKGAGRGLGTYSIRLLSERYLQGKVGFTTSHEDGTRFWLRLPLQMAGVEVEDPF